MKNIRWVIQEKLDIDALIHACEINNFCYELIKVIPFSTELPNITFDDKINIYYGSVNFINTLYKNLNPVGVFFNDQFSMEIYNNNWKSFMLNNDNNSKITTFKEFWNENHNDDTLFFCRPDADDKSFSGEVRTFKEIKNIFINTTVGDNITENTKILISTPYNITKEWRNYIINGKVVTSSLYRKNFKLNTNGNIPIDMIEFVEARCKEFTPHKIFTMDIALCGGDYYIIECGCINSAGLYSADVTKLINDISNNI